MVSNDDIPFIIEAANLSADNQSASQSAGTQLYTVPLEHRWSVRLIEGYRDEDTYGMSVHLRTPDWLVIHLLSQSSGERITYEPTTILRLPAGWSIYILYVASPSPAFCSSALLYEDETEY